MKKLIVLNKKDFKGLLHIKNEFRFLNQQDIIKFLITILYKNKSVLVIYDCKKAFEVIPKLNIKKRDDFTIYMMGKLHDFLFIEFDSPLVASDWAFSFPTKERIHWEVYSNGILLRNEKGKIYDNQINPKGI